MEEELKKLIEANLPGLAAGKLKDYLEQAEKDKKQLAHVTSQLNEKNAEFIKIQNENNSFKSKESEILSKELSQISKQKELDLKEFNLKVEELKYQLEAEKSSKGSIFELVRTFVANPRAIEVLNKSTHYATTPRFNRDGDETGSTVHGSHETGTIEKKEEK